MSTAIAAEPPDDLATALAKHADTVSRAKAALGKAFLDRIKQAAQKEDLPTLKELIAQKESFDADDTLPTQSQLHDDIVHYTATRRASASATFLAYQNTIQAYVAKDQTEAANQLEREAKEFTESESAAISLNMAAKTKAELRKAEPEPTEKTSSNSTKEKLASFFLLYGKMLDDVHSQPTTVKQDQSHRAWANKLDTAIKNQTWEFHCRIKDIQPIRSSENLSTPKYRISHELPEEAELPDQKWNARLVSELALTPQQIQTLKPGDLIIYTGTPRFSAVGQMPSDGTEYFMRTERIAGEAAHHTVHFTNVKVRFQKQTDSQ